MKRTAVLAILLAMTWASRARADDVSLEGLLAEDVVTSVSKTPETATDAPALTRSISADEIHRYGMTSVDEALDFLGVGMHSEHNFGRSEMTVRGVAFTGDRSNHILLLVDGHIINDPLYGDASFDQRLGIPLELIDHVELVLGPGSAIYGSNAVLAVVNVVTKSASTNAGFHAASEVGSDGSQRFTLTTGQRFDLWGKRASFTGGLGYFHHEQAIDLPREQLIDPLSRQPYTWGGTARHANTDDTAGLHLRFSRDRLDVMARAVSTEFGDIGGIGDFDGSSGTKQRRASLAISQSLPIGSFGDITGTLSADTFRERRSIVVSRMTACPFGNTQTCRYDESDSSNRVAADVRVNLDWLHDGRLVTIVGGSASLDHVDSSYGGYDNRTNAAILPWAGIVNISSVTNLAANAQQSWRPLDWLGLVAGARVDWRKVDDVDGSRQEFTPVMTPRLALTVYPWRGATAKVLYAQAFRAPNPYELDANNANLIASNNLQPERTDSTEAIVEQRFGQQRLMVGVFRTQYHGIINDVLLSAADLRAAIAAGQTLVSYDPNLPIYQYRAADYVETHGLNTGFDGALLQNRLRFGASLTATIARADHVERISVAPQWFGNARASYEFGANLPTVALATSFSGDALADRAYDAGFKHLAFAPAGLSTRIAVTGAVPWVKGLSYRAIVSAQTQAHSPYSVGPVINGQNVVDAPTLAPMSTWKALVGLHYDF